MYNLAIKKRRDKKLSKLKNLFNQSGFTAVEIIIVIVIVAILAAILIPSLLTGPVKTRDTTRKNNIKTIKIKLEEYYQDNGAYPATLEELTGGNPPYIKPLPVDPKTKKEYTYSPAPAGGPYTSYVLSANLETKSDKDAPNGIYSLDSSN